MKSNQKKSNAGFSLVELMVVVAIIGILATIAVPNFQRFQAKAKQSNAKVELSGMYTAEKSFMTEYGTYASDLVSIGYTPDGWSTTASTSSTTRYYAAGFSQAASAVSLPAGVAANANPAAGFSGTVCSGGILLSALPGTSISQNAFTASALGCPNPSAATKDSWAITHDKNLSNTTSGI